MKKKSRKRFSEEKLYDVSLRLSKDDRDFLGLRFPAKIFVQDPFVARQHEEEGVLGLEEIQLDWEPGIDDGPTNSRIAVVDYNINTGVIAKPVQWDRQTKQFIGADDPKSFQFHQVNVWAIIQNILAFFEDSRVMGRPIPWGFDGNRLIVLPHASIEKNAYYSRKSKCLQFCFFIHEGEPVYTCLSHDIIAHETGHAILDGIRPYYFELSSIQTAGFHEFIADLTAILSALSATQVRHAIADASQGDIWNSQVISDLGEEFAEKDSKKRYGSAQRYYLRTAQNEKKMKEIENEVDPHKCSEVLTGAMFEILAHMTTTHLKEEGQTSRNALWTASTHLNRMAFRALDYCPPVDIQFVDYVQAVVRADELTYPMDRHEYRKIVKEVFENRGIEEIYPKEPPRSVELTWRYDISSIANSRTAAYHFLNDNREPLDIPLHQDFQITDLYYTDKVAGANERLPREIILEYVWKEDIPLKGKVFGQLENKKIALLCGGTLVFDERGNILHWSKKGGTQTGEGESEGKQRRTELLAFVKRLLEADLIGWIDAEAYNTLTALQPPIAGYQEGNVLKFEITPQFLNPSKELGE